MSIIATICSATNNKPKVERTESGNYAYIRFGHNVSIMFDMEDLRDLCNDIAEVLDVWYEEADRLGRSASVGRDTNVSLPEERDRNGK